MTCNGCGNKAAYRLRVGHDEKTGEKWEACDSCGALPSVSVPDVFFPGPYIDPNLVHRNRPWEKNGVLVTSKRHKAQLLREQNLVEAGDAKNGSRNFDPALARRAKEQGHGPIRL